MSKIIAISGKGGTGKTTIAALLVRAFKENGAGPVLAVDADPNANLGDMLGVKVESTIGDICEEAKRNESFPAGMTKNEYLRFMLERIVSEEDGFDLLTMGRPEGPGCYCYANNILRDSLKMLTANYKFVIIDNEAGFEHISRKTNLKIDYLVIVTDPSLPGVDTAEKILNLAEKIGLPIAKSYVIINRAHDNVGQTIGEKAKSIGVEILATVKEDNCISKQALSGKSIFAMPTECVTLKTINSLVKKFNNTN